VPSGTRPVSGRSRPPFRDTGSWDLRVYIPPPAHWSQQRQGTEPVPAPHGSTGSDYSSASTENERLTGFEPVTSTMARWCSGLLSYNRMERVTGLEPALRPWESHVLPITLHSHGAFAEI
jgi:hypothetical protein